MSDKERKLHYDSLFKDIAGVLVAKCVNADTNRPYTISMLERSLHDIHFAVDPKRPAKQQALEVAGALLHLPPLCNSSLLDCIRMCSLCHCAARFSHARRNSGLPILHMCVLLCDLTRKLRPCAATLQAVPELQKVIPIRRARMRLKLQVPSSAEHELEQFLRKEDAVIEAQSAMQAQVLQIGSLCPGRVHQHSDMSSVGAHASPAAS